MASLRTNNRTTNRSSKDSRAKSEGERKSKRGAAAGNSVNRNQNRGRRAAADSDEDEENAYPKSPRRRLGPSPETRSPSPNVDEYGRPAGNLKLEYVFGYRGYDCRDNVHFTKSGKLAFHVAGVGVLFDKESGHQEFYIGHTDDITSLAVHPKKDIIATGQVGRSPKIHVWDSKNLSKLAVLEPKHKSGICALTFSPNGRKLASVGMDQEHTVTLWDWKAGDEICRGKGHGDKVFAGFATGGRDGTVVLWDENMEKPNKPYTTQRKNMLEDTILADDNVIIRAIAVDRGSIVIGTKCGEILEINRRDRKVRTLVQGHAEGELWGLAPHPTRELCATVSDDGFLRIWDFETEEHFKLTALFKLGKAARSVAYSNNGKLLAVGFKNGRVKVFSTKKFQQMLQFHNRKESISDLKFSPDRDQYLAVGSHDNFIDIYEIKSGKRVGVGQGASSYITHLDFDESGKIIQINSGAKEHLFFESPHGKRTTLTDDEVEDTPWRTWTGVLGEPVIGIFPESSNITDVNATHLHPDKKTLAVGDDFGYVKLFTYPSAEEHAKCKKYLGHSSHVTNVRWSHDGKRLLSVGGQDTALLVWSLEGGSSESRADTYTESEEEDTEH